MCLQCWEEEIGIGANKVWSSQKNFLSLQYAKWDWGIM